MEQNCKRNHFCSMRCLILSVVSPSGEFRPRLKVQMALQKFTALVQPATRSKVFPGVLCECYPGIRAFPSGAKTGREGP
jgi:hypothetical protein